MKIKEILEYGKNNLIQKEDAYRLSKILLKHLLDVTDSYILINGDEKIPEDIVGEFKGNIELLKNGIPLQYITKHQEFMGLDFYVDSNVLIPQPDTEVLVEEVINIYNYEKQENKPVGGTPQGDLQKYKILDLCTGSGAIGIAISKHIENVEITMSDISNNALEIAKKNSESNKVMNKCKFILSDMFENIQEKFDIIVSNPPYIKTEVIKTLDKEVQNEPNLALDGGEDGLKFYKIIAENAYKHLNKNGILALEIGYDQKDEVMNLLKQTGKYTKIYFKKDLAGNDRAVICNTFNIQC